MILRILAGIMVVAVLALQYRLWLSRDGTREVWRLEQAIEEQVNENDRLRQRNRTLAAEVRDLKEGRAAVEERARTDLGMVGVNETFFQVVPPDASAPQQAVPEQRTAQADAG